MDRACCWKETAAILPCSDHRALSGNRLDKENKRLITQKVFFLVGVQIAHDLKNFLKLNITSSCQPAFDG